MYKKVYIKESKKMEKERDRVIIPIVVLFDWRQDGKGNLRRELLLQKVRVNGLLYWRNVTYIYIHIYGHGSFMNVIYEGAYIDYSYFKDFSIHFKLHIKRWNTLFLNFLWRIRKSELLYLTKCSQF